MASETENITLDVKVLQNEDISGIRLYVANSNKSASKVYKALGMDGERYGLFEWMKEG